jgi:pyruvate,water dikinase
MSDILFFSELSGSNLLEVGGKAQNLGRLWEWQLNVPNGFVVTTSAFQKFRDKTDVIAVIDNARRIINTSDEFEALNEQSLKIKKSLFDKESLANRMLKKKVTEAFRRLTAESVSVRSSATIEDSLATSFAGQFDSFLNVREEEIVHNVIKCWASLYNTRALFYYRQHKINLSNCAMAVIVQQMVDADVSGVIFTKDHLKGECVLIEAVKGYGESLVSGESTPDSYWVDRKTQRVVEKRGSQDVADSFVARLAQGALRIENLFGRPQDIEFSIKDQIIYVLQARPITKHRPDE